MTKWYCDTWSKSTTACLFTSVVEGAGTTDGHDAASSHEAEQHVATATSYSRHAHGDSVVTNEGRVACCNSGKNFFSKFCFKSSSVIYTTIGDACVCVCKIGPISARTLSFRRQTSRNFHIATFPSPTFGPLFAFHCPLFFLRKRIIYMPRCFEK